MGRMSASQLAALQATQQNANVQQAAAAAANGGAAANGDATVTLPDGTPATQIPVKPTGTDRRTVTQVNTEAPTYQTPAGVAFRPQLATGSQQQGAGNPGKTGLGSSSKALASTDIISTKNLDNEIITGDNIGQIVGVKIATPFFGTGFNFCIDRYFGSFPKVGIVIPNAAAWLLPDFQELGNALNMVVDMPTILPHGTRIDTTSDGFLLWLPSFQPSQVPNFGFRYGIQIGQAFGFDFGYGLIKDICFISFAIV
ncbi:hypothetical protein WJX81_007709 [Elliptochloris bilobata]|uniref:Uncharacterized protein n=1 Tax=Elliptochloris bilobata TaxID=381761 RepID=A0AAW1RQL3_9CHLO